MRRITVAVLVLLCASAGILHAQNASVSVTVNPSIRHAISADIYGVAYTDAGITTLLQDLNAPINRRGGNPATRYNWQANADNRCQDWYYESLPYSSALAGGEADTFVNDTLAAGSEPMITIPMIGWLAKLGANRTRLSSFSIAKYGAQQYNDWQWYPDAGNGYHTDTTPITGNDPNDASILTDSNFQAAWVTHLVNQWGASDAGGVRYYLMDNEASIWFSSHRDVMPTGVTMDDMRNRIIDYAGKVKSVDPKALVAAPEEWGWDGFLFSGYDQWYAPNHGWATPDRDAHGGVDYAPYLLAEMKKNWSQTGTKLLDVFSLHYYPQGGEFGDVVDTPTQLLRNRSTRSLWDPNYIDESWINDTVMLIPRMKNWVAANHPGLKIGITEYNWGAEGHINGATTQADILGILGREGVDIATRWEAPGAGTPTYNAMKMYRNYDGAHSTFGDIGVPLTGADPDNVAAFSALRNSDGAMTVMVISKYLSGNTPFTLNAGTFAHGSAVQVWRLTSTNAITHLADIAMGGSSFSTTLPPQSITLYVIPSSAPAPAPTVAAITPTRGPAGGGTGLTISGTNFFAGSGVTIGGTAIGSRNIVNGTTITGTAPALPAGTLNDVVVTIPNTLKATLPGGYFAQFTDMPAGVGYQNGIESIFRAAITSGCGGGMFCPNGSVTRAQMAVFLLRGSHGSDYSPLPGTGAVFTDVTAGAFAAGWIEQVYGESITTGCALNPLRYCPDAAVTRAQMAVFLLKAKYGAAYVPPAAVGLFSDVPQASGFAPWIEDLYNQGITGGCAVNPLKYCPGAAVTRAQMAVFLKATFGLP